MVKDVQDVKYTLGFLQFRLPKIDYFCARRLIFTNITTFVSYDLNVTHRTTSVVVSNPLFLLTKDSLFLRLIEFGPLPFSVINRSSPIGDHNEMESTLRSDPSNPSKPEWISSLPSTWVPTTSLGPVVNVGFVILLLVSCVRSTKGR